MENRGWRGKVCSKTHCQTGGRIFRRIGRIMASDTWTMSSTGPSELSGRGGPRPSIGPDKGSVESVHSAGYEVPGAPEYQALPTHPTPAPLHLAHPNVFSLLLSACPWSQRIPGAFSHKAFNYHINPAHSDRAKALAGSQGEMCAQAWMHL